MESKYNKKAKTYNKVVCSQCGKPREIYRIGKDNKKKFWCSDCHKFVWPKK